MIKSSKEVATVICYSLGNTVLGITKDCEDVFKIFVVLWVLNNLCVEIEIENEEIILDECEVD